MLVELTFPFSKDIGLLRLCRPEKHNALSLPMLDAWEAALVNVRAKSPKVLVIAGSGGTFCSGADISALRTSVQQDTAAAFSGRIRMLWQSVADLPSVTIAAVEGYALGGGMELALAADMRVAAEDASFGVPEAQLGLFPAAGGTVRLVELLGRSLAARLLFTGQPMQAGELPTTFFAAVTQRGEAETEAIAIAKRVASAPAATLRAIKALVSDRRAPGHGQAMELEALAFARLALEPDVRARLDAFLRRQSR